MAAATEVGPAARHADRHPEPHARPAGSPLEITYKFVVARREVRRGLPRLRPRGRHRRRADVDRRSQSAGADPQWKPGQTVEYTRTIFVPVFPYVGDAAIQVGLHSTKDQRRVPLAGEDVGQQRLHASPGSSSCRRPRTCSPCSRTAGTRPNRGQRSRARMAVDQEGGDARVQEPEEGRRASISIWTARAANCTDAAGTGQLGGQTVETFTLRPDERVLHKVKLPAALMGDGRLAELQIAVDKTFVPAVVIRRLEQRPARAGRSRVPRVRRSAMTPTRTRCDRWCTLAARPSGGVRARRGRPGAGGAELVLLRERPQHVRERPSRGRGAARLSCCAAAGR